MKKSSMFRKIRHVTTQDDLNDPDIQASIDRMDKNVAAARKKARDHARAAVAKLNRSAI